MNLLASELKIGHFYHISYDTLPDDLNVLLELCEQKCCLKLLISKFRYSQRTADCGWMPLSKIKKIEEVKLEDFPLYLSWPYIYPAFEEYLRG
jgi:hypothetical protein